MPSDIDPRSGFRLPLPNREDLDDAGKATYDPAKITVPTLLIQAEWDQDTPPYMSKNLFPLLVNAPEKRYVMIGEGTHTVIMERNRMQLFREVQAFLDEGAAAAKEAKKKPVHTAELGR